VILWLNPFGGISGDMLLGALLGLGAPLDTVRDAVASTGITGWRLERIQTTRAGLAATRAEVSTDEGRPPQRRAAELIELVGRARPAPAAALATRALTALVGVAAALHALAVTEVHCGPLALGTGSVRTRHGELPVPAPATSALLARMAAPVTPADVEGETVTPTGAALLLAAGTRFGPVPAMSVRAVGYGAGSRDTEGRPNVVQALLGSVGDVEAGEGRVMLRLETNVDDVTGELLGHLVGRLLEEGAADAWISPVVMKKGRPAHTVHVLVDPSRAAACERVLLAETGTLGLRRYPVERLALPRQTRTVEVDGQPIRVKYGPWGGKPEHDDVVRAAERLGLPLRRVARRALSLADDLDPE
jgi:hypothetical protein